MIWNRLQFWNSFSRNSMLILLLSSTLILSRLSCDNSAWAFLFRPVNIVLASSSIHTDVSSMGPIFFLTRPWKPTLDWPLPPEAVSTIISPFPMQYCRTQAIACVRYDAAVFFPFGAESAVDATYAHGYQVTQILAYDYLCARVAFFGRYARHQWSWHSPNSFVSFLVSYSKINKINIFLSFCFQQIRTTKLIIF